MHGICAQKCLQEWRTKHRYAVPENLPILCWNHNETYKRFVRFNWHISKNRGIPGSQLSASTEQVVPRRKYWCDWAMVTMTMIGNYNPHQEHCQFSTIWYVNCQHEGCMAYVHQFCQHDWLERHCYAVPTNLPFFCRNHTESYGKWVRFTAGLIPLSQNGCIQGSVAAINESRRHV